MKSHLSVLFFGLWSVALAQAAFDARQEAVRFMEKSGMKERLAAPVRVTVSPAGPLTIFDDGTFLVQHTILDAQHAPDPNVLLDPAVSLPQSVDKLVIITHGWLDKGKDRWPSEMAEAFYARVDPNEWLCGSFDWKGGSGVITSIQAAEYARDVAGPRLAAAVCKLGRRWTHIHLVGHSAGAWTIQSAAAKLASACPDAVFHLTFLDAYVPSRWDPQNLGRIFEDPKHQQTGCWAEHYYTRDFTLFVTEHDLKWAHNVDISALDPLITEHEFPYRWYMATITGSYGRWDEKDLLVHCLQGDTDYGFARSLESAPENWSCSMCLPRGGRAIVFHKPPK